MNSCRFLSSNDILKTIPHRKGDNRMGFYVNPPADAFQAVLKSKIYIDKSEQA